jgi:hypothetical protein
MSVVRFQTSSRWMHHSLSDNGNPTKQTDTRTNSAVCSYSFEERWFICVDRVWNVKAHAQKTDFVFRRNGRVHLNRRGRQFSRLLAAEVCASAVVMLDTPCSEVVWRVLATHSVSQFLLRFPSRASPCVITFQLNPTTSLNSGRFCVLLTLCVCLLGLFITMRTDHITGQH